MNKIRLETEDAFRIKLNESVLIEINRLQTGGSLLTAPENINFNDAGIDELTADLTDLSDFILYLYQDGSTVEIEPERILKHCQTIRQIKKHLDNLRATQIKR